MTAATEVLTPGAAGTATTAARSGARLFWERFREDKTALGAAVVILLLIFIAFFGGPIAVWLTGHPNTESYNQTMLDPFGLPRGPNAQFWFGADGEGRDLFVRVMYGTRTSLVVGVLASLIAVLIGLVVGLIAGFYRGVADTALSRFGDVMLSIPSLLISIGIVAACSSSKEGCLVGPALIGLPDWFSISIQPGEELVIAIIVLFTWPYVARIVRGFALSLREKEFVEASRSLGASNFRIIVREILPNLAGPLIVWTTLLIPQSILFEAALSYLGLGVPPQVASWGGLLNDAQRFYNVAWWLMLFPGLFLVITTLAFNLLGDGLRDALDVRADR